MVVEDVPSESELTRFFTSSASPHTVRDELKVHVVTSAGCSSSCVTSCIVSLVFECEYVWLIVTQGRSSHPHVAISAPVELTLSTGRVKCEGG